MGRIKIRHYSVDPKTGRGFWKGSASARAMGFPSSYPCGPDGPDAWKIAEEWNARWDRARTGREPAPKHVYPRGSAGEAFDRLQHLDVWAAKKPRTREDWRRGWRYIEPVFADVDPRTVTVEHFDAFYSALKKSAGVREAHRAVKIWRAFWQVAAAMGYCSTIHDFSFAIRRETPQARTATWREGEVVRLVKESLRRGYHGLAGVIAAAYDTSLAPVDVRSLTFAQSRTDGRQVWFEVERAKTGRAAIGTLTRRSVAVLSAYLGLLPIGLLPSAPIFRNRSGSAYTKNKLAEDFRAIRTIVFPGDDRKLMDMRRSGAVEALVGSVDPGALGAKMANTIAGNKALQKTYLPVDRDTVERADKARRRGRSLILQNKTGLKVEILRPGELKLQTNDVNREH